MIGACPGGRHESKQAKMESEWLSKSQISLKEFRLLKEHAALCLSSATLSLLTQH